MNWIWLADVDFTGPYALIIEGAVILLLSFIYNIIAKKTNIPSVLLLILTGMLIKLGLDHIKMGSVDWMPVLEVLGVIGLIMIVLEAALDLELKKKHLPLIGRAVWVALTSLLASVFLVALLIQQFIEISYVHALLYATPLCILSSAIIIPSVGSLSKKDREFMIYEGTFSDILGIMLFYFLISLIESGGGAATLQFGISFLVTTIVGVLASYLLVFLFKDLEGHTLFLLIAVLLLLYALGKLLHLSPLLIILIFGLALANHQRFFRIFKNSFDKDDPIEKIEKDFHMITAETAFVVRTFFFVVFGMTIEVSQLFDWEVLLKSGAIVLILYVVRFVMLRWTDHSLLLPQLWIAPRGLITILLFFAIPANLINDQFQSGILLYVILITSIIMSVALIREGRS